ncbi:hypothetical protein Nos7107_0530 [Nostoc sp. PCC 7107]|nr:hypothetical protein Nos7107_0530 [Nostoc sp. PCC 7107]
MWAVSLRAATVVREAGALPEGLEYQFINPEKTLPQPLSTSERGF